MRYETASTCQDKNKKAFSVTFGISSTFPFFSVSVYSTFQQIHELEFQFECLNYLLEVQFFALVCHLWRSQNKSVSRTWMWLRSCPQCWAPGAWQMTSIQRRKGQEESLGKPTPIQFWSHKIIQGLFNDLTVEDRSTRILWEWKQRKGILVLEDCIFTNKRELNYEKEGECKMLD